MTPSYLVTIVTAITELVSKYTQRINEQLQKTLGADDLSPTRKIRKTVRGVSPPERPWSLSTKRKRKAKAQYDQFKEPQESTSNRTIVTAECFNITLFYKLL